MCFQPRVEDTPLSLVTIAPCERRSLSSRVSGLLQVRLRSVELQWGVEVDRLFSKCSHKNREERTEMRTTGSLFTCRLFFTKQKYDTWKAPSYMCVVDSFVHASTPLMFASFALPSPSHLRRILVPAWGSRIPIIDTDRNLVHRTRGFKDPATTFFC